MNLQTELFMAYVEYKAKHQRHVIREAEMLHVGLNAGDVLCLTFVLWVELSSVANEIKRRHESVKRVSMNRYFGNIDTYEFVIRKPQHIVNYQGV